MGLTNNFNEELIHFIKYLENGNENIKKIYMNNNNLSSLECLTEVKFNITEEFWAINNKINDIKEINYLINKEKIKAIYLNENNISKIDNDFLNILESFPNLKMINLEKNPINFIAKNIKEKIESKRVNIVF